MVTTEVRDEQRGSRSFFLLVPTPLAQVRLGCIYSFQELAACRSGCGASRHPACPLVPAQCMPLLALGTGSLAWVKAHRQWPWAAWHGLQPRPHDRTAQRYTYIMLRPLSAHLQPTRSKSKSFTCASHRMRPNMPTWPHPSPHPPPPFLPPMQQVQLHHRHLGGAHLHRGALLHLPPALRAHRGCPGCLRQGPVG